MQLCDFWREDDRKPHPGKKLLAERLGLSEKQVQRHIAELEQFGLVKRVERHAAHCGRMANTYDLTGLVERLKKLEPEFRKVEEDAKRERKAVKKRGYKLKGRPSANVG